MDAAREALITQLRTLATLEPEAGVSHASFTEMGAYLQARLAVLAERNFLSVEAVTTHLALSLLLRLLRLDTWMEYGITDVGEKATSTPEDAAYFRGMTITLKMAQRMLYEHPISDLRELRT